MAPEYYVFFGILIAGVLAAAYLYSKVGDTVGLGLAAVLLALFLGVAVGACQTVAGM